MTASEDKHHSLPRAAVQLVDLNPFGGHILDILHIRYLYYDSQH